MKNMGTEKFKGINGEIVVGATVVYEGKKYEVCQLDYEYGSSIAKLRLIGGYGYEWFACRELEIAGTNTEKSVTVLAELVSITNEYAIRESRIAARAHSSPSHDKSKVCGFCRRYRRLIATLNAARRVQP